MQRILAGIDFSRLSEPVTELAASLAQAFSAELTLVHVAAPDPDFVGYAAGPESVRDARARELRHEHRELQAMAEALRQRGIASKALLLQGPTAESILDEARRRRATILVLGSHGHGAIHRVLVGSTTQAVLRDPPCPVLVVPASPRP